MRCSPFDLFEAILSVAGDFVRDILPTLHADYCAYDVAVGKKFHIHPEAWRLADGKLYLNLDAEIQKKWHKDIPGYIE